MVHTAVQSIEGILKEMCSPLPPLLPSLQSPERTETSKFPVQAKAKKPSDVPSIEEIFREMSSSLPALLSHLQTPPRAETSKLPLATKESHPDGSAAQKQKQAGTASETLPSSQPRALALQSQHKRVAAAQPSSSESGSTRECHSSSVCDREISCSDSEEDNLPRVLDLPVREPEPSTAKKWRLDNLVTQRKQGLMPREGPREIACGNGREEGVKQEQGISISSCQHHSKAREPPPKSCGQVAEDTHKTSGQTTKHFHKTSGQVTQAQQESHIMSTHSSLKPLVHTKEALPRKTVGIKRPSKPLGHDKWKKVLKLESESGPLEVRDQSCKQQPRDKKTEELNSTTKKALQPALHKPSEERKDKGSQQAKAKGFLDARLLRHAQECDALIPSDHRPGEWHREKVPLPPGEKKLFLPLRKADLKRKAMRSPEESPGKKKREDNGDPPRKRKE